MSAVPDDPLTEEVRVALALNGGVSLAVWMGGCAVELDCARRAHLSPEPRGENLPPRTAYHALCQAFGRELVIDIMSGASAGGINGALLGAAIRHRRRLAADFIRNSWLDLGDFGGLLQRTSNPSPAALMQGDAFHESLLKVFQGIMGAEGVLPPGQEALKELDVKLDVTTTNLVGERRAFRDFWGRELVAREYRARFSFRQRDDYTAEALSVAARSSASFPFAFEPWEVDCQTGRLAGFPQMRWVVDGGLLDNAPIKAALELLPTRGARRQVRRFLCYLNAEPVADEPNLLGGETMPPLVRVAGSVVNLPRKAPFVDQLDAIERATRKGRLGDQVPEMELVRADFKALARIAEDLVASYRRRRLLLSIEELVGAAEAQPLIAALPDEADLPWLPSDLRSHRADGGWQWGISPAERTVQLLVDILRRSATGAPAAVRVLLLEARGELDGPLNALRGMRRGLLDVSHAGASPPATLELAVAEMEMVDPVESIREAAAVVFGVAAHLDDGLARGLFGRGGLGDGTLSDRRFRHFLKRALAIEVVRRSVVADAEMEPAQELRFAQLTPYAPGLVFTGSPATKSGWATPQEKLTGLGLGHFAGFYRRSWRVNDFMWGRLDAAARVIDLLVAPGRAEQLFDDGASPPPWERLARALTQMEPATEQRWLILETLDDWYATHPEAEPAVPGDLLDNLSAALETDLMEPDAPGRPRRGDLTRLLFTRAAQLEILHQELPLLNQESAKDRKLGAGAKSIKLPEALGPAIQELRTGDPLPQRLTAADEAASALALRTGAHAGLVALAMLRAAGMPLKRVLFSLRALLLPVAGAVARSRWYRLGTVAVVTATAVFLASRLLTTRKTSASVGFPIEAADGMTAIALLVILGILLVPGLRFARAHRWRVKLPEAAWFLAIASLSVGAGIALTHWVGGLTGTELVAGQGAHAPPDAVLAAAIGFVVGVPALAAPAFVRARVDALLRKPWGGRVALAPVLAIAGLLLAFSVDPVWSALGGTECWRRVTAGAALIGTPLFTGFYLFVWRRR